MTAQLKFIKVFINKALGFEGNTSVVLQYNELPSDEQMQAIAADFNQPASTFLSPADQPGKYNIRWFAPDGEIGLCGHGTAAAIAFLQDGKTYSDLAFSYPSGVLTSSHADKGHIAFKVASQEIKEQVHDNQILEKGLGVKVKEHYRTTNKNIVVVDNEEKVKEIVPDFALLATLPDFGFIVTAKGTESDIVCRTIVPKVKQLEDPATGSSHATLTPFWSKRLNKKKLTSYQLSNRGGYFECELISDNEVLLKGQYEIFAGGAIE